MKPKSGKLVSLKATYCSFHHSRLEGKILFWNGFEEPRKLEEGPDGWGFARVSLVLEISSEPIH